MSLEASIREHLLAMPEVSGWPDMVRLVQREIRPGSRPSWHYPATACEAVGGTAEQAFPGAVAVFCLLYSIHLVDDMLDDDPEGLYHEVGHGAAANLATAFQGAAARAVAEAGLAPERQAWIQESLGRMMLATAHGQYLDSQDLEGEEGYWRVVRLKTPPLFSSALFTGAVLGGASRQVADDVAGFGAELGDIVQINDDLHDAMERPSSADWQRRWTNLPILYARVAEHDERARFVELAERIDDPGALEEAQEILVRSGAVSYCAYRLIETYRGARRRLAGLDLPRSDTVRELLDHHLAPLKKLFDAIGVEAPDRLFEG